ncbi:MAG: HNH endonuclease [Burkholderiales bacterium]
MPSVSGSDAESHVAEARADYVRSLAEPRAEEQLAFLSNLQRILQEGDFSATYKFALLIALTELAVERGEDGTAPLRLEIAWIAEKFAELYWPQTIPYRSGVDGDARILAQNLGQTAKVAATLLRLREVTGANSISQARESREWQQALAAIGQTVRTQPLKFLQNVGGGTLDFIYSTTHEPLAIELRPGVAFNFRRFSGLIGDLARSGWIRHVRANSRNRELIGESGDLESFMFGTQRAALEPVREFLHSFQASQCFYCGRRLNSGGDVDHFIPWSLYPRDLAHNFVLAHEECNRSKSDMLAGLTHLRRWKDRNRDHGIAIGEEIRRRGFVNDLDCSHTVARWAYRHAARTSAHGWLARGCTEPIGSDHFASVS